jgi:hypothetical protein
VEFDRKATDPHNVIGFALDWSDDLTLVHVLNSDRMELNGYSVIRNPDVRRWRPLGASGFISRALNIGPIYPDGISVTNWRDLLESACQRFSLLTLHREMVNPRVCYVGRVISVTERIVTLKKIDADARWGERKRYRLHDLTKVDFGGGYEEALAIVAAEYKRKRA